MKCKDCKFYSTEAEKRWATCSNPMMRVADAYSDYTSVKKDGIGYSDENYSEELAELYVGEDFGCIHYKHKLHHEFYKTNANIG